MNTIGELLARDLRQPIEEIIKVDQTNEESVYTEITEYIATERIQIKAQKETANHAETLTTLDETNVREE